MRHPAAFINAIAEGHNFAEAINHLQITWDQLCDAREESAADWSTVLLALSTAREYPDFDNGQSEIAAYLEEAITIAEKRIARLHSKSGA